MSAPSSTAITITDLACDRGGRRVFDGVSFTLSPGEALQVEGPNGAGKSSLLRLLGGLLAPAAGTIDNPYRVAWAGHDVALKPGVTLADELAHWARLDGAEPAAVAAAVAAFALTPLVDLPAGILSSGQRRRASLARAMASGAELWLLDEPGVGLDTASLGLLAAAIGRHRAAGGLVVAVTHGEIGIDCPQTLRLGA
ncbi:heme ABC exporter ATP-binding protein CcmA [Polymorphobacter sp. PAMC 29334]|uniref:heme ABC exporter ATP-binding protein CcmA n=1 Tax=Polymorphobacter sp. PAMC 29334 TaxID=2862331 RepID=UPI001D028682|nr:heme ABC exporter ATP-binding protein CcmA [Polymorphobacter sp. PAMC 29334]